MDRVLVVAFMVAWGLWEARLAARGRRGRPSPADRGSLVGLVVAIAVGYSIAFTMSFVPAGRLPGAQPLWLLVGAACIAAGLVIRARAMATLDDAFTYHVQVTDRQRLVEAGPYRFVRHPAYLGQLLVLLGVGAALGSCLSILGVLAPSAAAFLWRIHVEESALRAAFGARFDAYARRTRRLIPGLY